MKKLISEVSGLVYAVEARKGQVLNAGDTVLIIECMKMEVPVVCEHAGRLREVLVEEGDKVVEGQTLALLD